MQKHHLLFVFQLLALLFLGSNLLAQGQEADSHPGNFYTIEKDYENSQVDGYNLYVPKSYQQGGDAFPLIVFLQGGLGVGGSVDVIFNWELPKELKESKGLETELDELKLNTFIYVMPHISRGQFFGNEQAIKQILKEVSDKYQIDEQRIYLTGLSRGGHGSWGVGSNIPEQFAAIAPICGSPQGIADYAGLVNIPIWTAHNMSDEVVGYEGTRKTVERIEKISGERFYRSSTVAEADYENNDQIFTSGEGAQKGHDAWTEMYNEVNFYKWLLRFRRE